MIQAQLISSSAAIFEQPPGTKKKLEKRASRKSGEAFQSGFDGENQREQDRRNVMTQDSLRRHASDLFLKFMKMKGPQRDNS